MTNPKLVESATPLPLREITPTTRISYNFKDLTGLKHPAFTVVGRSAGKKPRWVCRCNCGTYVLRKSATIIAGTAGACYACNAARKKTLVGRVLRRISLLRKLFGFQRKDY